MISYWELKKFMAPLGIIYTLKNLNNQIVASAILRNEVDATDTLSIFGVLYYLFSFIVSPLTEGKQIIVVFHKSENDKKSSKPEKFLWFCALVLSFLCILTLIPPLPKTIANWHGILENQPGSQLRDQRVVKEFHLGLALFAPLPLSEAIRFLAMGHLVLHKRTSIIGISGIIETFSILLFSLLWKATLPKTTLPILYPLLTIWSSKIIATMILIFSLLSIQKKSKKYQQLESAHEEEEEPQQQAQNDHVPITYKRLFFFFLPLAFTMTIQGVTRPAVNFLVGRSGGSTALAVLSIVFPLSNFFYGWTNSLRSVRPAYRKEQEKTDEDQESILEESIPQLQDEIEQESIPQQEDDIELRDFNQNHNRNSFRIDQFENNKSVARIKKFSIGCISIALMLMAFTFWIKPVREYVLIDILGATSDLAKRAAYPLAFFVFFPIPVGFRGNYHGIAISTENTKALFPSGVFRIIAVITTVPILISIFLHFQWDLAICGVIGMFFGFCAETYGCRWGLRRIMLRRTNAI